MWGREITKIIILQTEIIIILSQIVILLLTDATCYTSKCHHLTYKNGLLEVLSENSIKNNMEESICMHKKGNKMQRWNFDRFFRIKWKSWRTWPKLMLLLQVTHLEDTRNMLLYFREKTGFNKLSSLFRPVFSPMSPHISPLSSQWAISLTLWRTLCWRNLLEKIVKLLLL